MTDALIAAAAETVRSGGVIVYPTETVYGLGVDATDARAVGRLVELKRRPETKGISLLVADLDAAAGLIAGEMPAPARRLARELWPGPLTIVLPAATSVAHVLRGATGGVGLRCSCDTVCRRLLARIGRPLTSTSANPAGRAPATTIDMARAYFAERVDDYLDDGPREGVSVSTVVEFLGGAAYLRRSGAVPTDRISRIVPIRTED